MAFIRKLVVVMLWFSAMLALSGMHYRLHWITMSMYFVIGAVIAHYIKWEGENGYEIY